MLRVFRVLLLSFLFKCSKCEDIEIVHLQFSSNNNDSAVPLTFRAFGRKFNLSLKLNDNLSKSKVEIWKRSNNSRLDRLNYPKSSSCYYSHRDSSISAAINLCEPSGVVRISHFSWFSSTGSIVCTIKETQQNETKPPRLTVELGVFFDAWAYRIFRAQLDSDEELVDLLLAYVNNIQALYQHPSLGREIDVAPVRLELMERQPAELATLEGQRDRVLDSFCQFSKESNPPGDEEPLHWDVGLYITGLNLYSTEADGEKNYVTMGLARVGGVCWDDYACVITEFGVDNELTGKPYPSAGFQSVYVAAHEIAHNLGIQHDATGNSCPKDGYIMSPSRGVQGESQWSACSRESASKIHEVKKCLLDGPESEASIGSDALQQQVMELPGRRWSAKRQCEILLKNRKAVVVESENLCRALKCQSPYEKATFSAGPALDGTACQLDKECRAGDCLDKRPISSSVSNNESINELHNGICNDAADTTTACKKRRRAEKYAGERCRTHSQQGIAVAGVQMRHESERPWRACMIFCKQSYGQDSFANDTLISLLDLQKGQAGCRHQRPRDSNGNEDAAYFPDGTWCHSDHNDRLDYFCRKRRCTPKK
ncbi:uncharacterized protein LOC106660321 [Trichogramma pretiosum]|uniref:uncharacterized protein LOC106660321 n=1 Tax=Trichogramma pretiosum TaxID=7493 RepID=UPI000C71C35B|nr:uncharacterized protein LOC106660321 [Trichogramma pretiosum]